MAEATLAPGAGHGFLFFHSKLVLLDPFTQGRPCDSKNSRRAQLIATGFPQGSFDHRAFEPAEDIFISFGPGAIVDRVEERPVIESPCARGCRQGRSGKGIQIYRSLRRGCAGGSGRGYR